MLGDYAGRSLVATGVAMTFTGDLFVRFISSPNFIPACNLAGAVLAAGYAAWSSRRATRGAKAPSAATIAAAAETIAAVADALSVSLSNLASPPTPPATPPALSPAEPAEEFGPVS